MGQRPILFFIIYISSFLTWLQKVGLKGKHFHPEINLRLTQRVDWQLCGSVPLNNVN